MRLRHDQLARARLNPTCDSASQRLRTMQATSPRGSTGQRRPQARMGAQSLELESANLRSIREQSRLVDGPARAGRGRSGG